MRMIIKHQAIFFAMVGLIYFFGVAPYLEALSPLPPTLSLQQQQVNSNPSLPWMQVVLAGFVVIVWINVMVSTVDDAWEDCIEQATLQFWKRRIEFSLRMQDDNYYFDDDNNHDNNGGRSFVSRKVAKLCRRIHVLGGNRTVLDGIDWSVAPYNRISSAKEYFSYTRGSADDEDAMWLHNDNSSNNDLFLLQSMGSFERDWYWANEDASNNNINNTSKTKIALQLFVYLVVVAITGILTFGFVWPQRVRFGLMNRPSVLQEQKRKKEEDLEKQLGSLERQVKALGTRMAHQKQSSSSSSSSPSLPMSPSRLSRRKRHQKQQQQQQQEDGAPPPPPPPFPPGDDEEGQHDEGEQQGRHVMVSLESKVTNPDIKIMDDATTLDMGVEEMVVTLENDVRTLGTKVVWMEHKLETRMEDKVVRLQDEMKNMNHKMDALEEKLDVFMDKLFSRTTTTTTTTTPLSTPKQKKKIMTMP